MTNAIGGSGRRPMICTPLVGENETQLAEQLRQVFEKQPDIIEWRADFFTNLADRQAVVQAAVALTKIADKIPVLFTVRSYQEGGQRISLTDEAVFRLNAEICKKTEIEYIDCELRNSPEHIRQLRQISTACGKKLVGSFHNFDCTPTSEEIVSKLAEAEGKEMDMAKVAVMPQSLDDVLTLLSATLTASRQVNIPLITMSMGKYGAVSRMVGGVFGSALTFAVGVKASAPGQVAIEDLQAALDIIDRAMNA